MKNPDSAGIAAILCFAVLASACGGGSQAGAGTAERADLSEATTAFYETLRGDADHSERVVSLVRRAQQSQPNNALAFWMDAAMLTFQVSQAGTADVTRLRVAPPSVVEKLAEAQTTAERAAKLANEQGLHIPILPTWPGLTTFLHAYATGDASLRDLAVQRLRAGVDYDVQLGSLMFAATVGQFLDRTDPLFAEAVTLADRAVAGAAECTAARPDICDNQGAAPHGVEGALMIFGDLYAKDGQLDRAVAMYRLSAARADDDGWRFADLAHERMESAATRASLYADSDPENDPGFGVGEAFCGACHFR